MSLGGGPGPPDPREALRWSEGRSTCRSGGRAGHPTGSRRAGGHRCSSGRVRVDKRAWKRGGCGGRAGWGRTGQGAQGMAQWGSQGRGDGGQGTRTRARAGGSGRATAAGEHWNPETRLQPHRSTPPAQGTPPSLAPMQESLHLKSWVSLASWGHRDMGTLGQQRHCIRGAHVCLPSLPTWTLLKPWGDPQRGICREHGQRCQSPRVQSPAGTAVAWSDWDSKKRSVRCWLGTPSVPPSSPAHSRAPAVYGPGQT